MTKKASILIVFLLICCVAARAEERFPFLGEITSDDVNIRAGQSVNFERLCQLKQGREVVVLGRKYSWYKIRLPQEADCYVNAKYVQPRIENIGMVTTNRVNLRAGPFKDASLLGRVNKGTRVRIKGKKDDWYQIEPIQEASGWISDNFIKFKSYAVPPVEIVQEPSRNIYRQTKQVDEEKTKEERPIKEQEKKPELLTAVGRLEDLGRVVSSKDIRYKLVIDERTAYYLIGHSRIFDPFINLNVSIQGKVRPDPEGLYKYPVVAVSKINLVLSNYFNP